jgi:hypothetical protein
MPLHKPVEAFKSVVQFINPNTNQFEDIDMVESKPYLILMTEVDNPGDDECHEGRWISIRGRDGAFGYLEGECMGIDIVYSYVMTGHIHLGEEVSVYSFMRHCIESKKVHTNFTVDDLNAYASDLYPDLDLNLLYNKEINKGVK